MIDVSKLENTRPAMEIVSEEKNKRESIKSPNGSVPSANNMAAGMAGFAGR